MSSAEDLPRPLRILSMVWPIAISLAVGGATMVQATSRIASVEEKVTELHDEGPPGMRERLVRIETKQDAQAQTMERVEALLEKEGRRR